MTILQVAAELPTADCRCVRVSPDGTSVFTAGGGIAEVRDALSGQPGWMRDWNALAELPVEAMWGAAGETITVLSSARLTLLDAVTGADLAIPDALADRRDVTALALSDGGATLAVGTNAGAVLLWQQGTGQVTRLRGGGDPVTALAWRPAGAELCVARPRSVQFWRLPTETMISSIDVGDVYPVRIGYAPDGNLLAVTGLRDVRMLNVLTRSEGAVPITVDGRPAGLGFSRTGTALLVGLPDGSVEVLDRQLRRSSLQPGPRPAGLTEAACLHVNETGLAAVRTDAATVTLLRLPDTVTPDPGQRTAVAIRRWAARVTRALGPDTPAEVPPPVPEVIDQRSRFAWAESGWIRQDRAGGAVTRYTDDGRVRWQVMVPGRISVTGELVVAADDGPNTQESAITVLDAATGATIARVSGTGIANWSGHALAVAGPGRQDLLTYDASWSRRQRVTVSDRISDRVGDPAWSPDGTWLAAASAGAVLIWSWAGDRLTRARTVPVGGSPRPGAVAWSPDGRWLAVDRPGGRVTVYDARTWAPGPALGESAVGDSPLALGWSPDSRLIAIPASRVPGAVDLWDPQRGTIEMSLPPPPTGRTAVTAVAWAPDGRFAVTQADGTVIRWTFTPPSRHADAARLPHPPEVLAVMAAALAGTGVMVSPLLLGDLLSLLLGRDAGPLADLDGHPGIAMLRGLGWRPEAALGLIVLVASGLSGAADLQPPSDATSEEMRVALKQALGSFTGVLGRYQPPTAELLRELDRVDDSVLVLATMLGQDLVAAQPDLLLRVYGQSLRGWSLAPRQRKLLGLRTMLRFGGDAQGQGTGDLRAGISRAGQLPWLLPTQLALPRTVLAAKASRDELLFRTRQGSLHTVAQPVVLLLDNTPAAFGAVGVTIRVVASLLASLAIARHRRCALVTLGAPAAHFLKDQADLVHIWADGTVDRPDLVSALSVAATAAAELSDPVDGLPRLVLLTHPHQALPETAGLHVVRVHYPGLAVEDSNSRTHILAPDASPEQISAVIASILSDGT